ncbi:MAG: GrpB family protein [Nanobdellota archaeon]
MKYIYTEYDASYPELFKKEKENLQARLPDIPIEHVGSTAIPGLGGKGIIDIMIGSPDFQSVKQRLIDAGYEFREQASHPERLFFRKDYGKQRFHIHLTPKDSQDWNEIIVFRDRVRKNKALRDEYARLKQAAVKDARGDGERYRKYKHQFIQDVIRQGQTARALILNNENILLIHRFKNGREYFALPGGHIEPGETPEQATIREIKEEANLDIAIDRKLWTLNPFDDSEHHFYLVTDFTGIPQLGGPEKERNSEHNAYALEWHSLNEIEGLNILRFSRKD